MDIEFGNVARATDRATQIRFKMALEDLDMYSVLVLVSQTASGPRPVIRRGAARPIDASMRFN
jgi:hypothetical protein